MKFGVGQSVGRVEDRRFITGSGCYTDDVDPGAGLRIAFFARTLCTCQIEKP